MQLVTTAYKGIREVHLGRSLQLFSDGQIRKISFKKLQQHYNVYTVVQKLDGEQCALSYNRSFLSKVPLTGIVAE